MPSTYPHLLVSTIALLKYRLNRAAKSVQTSPVSPHFSCSLSNNRLPRWPVVKNLPTNLRLTLVAQLVRNQRTMQETWIWSLGWDDLLEKGKFTLFSILAWRISWTIQSQTSNWAQHSIRPTRSTIFYWSVFLLCLYLVFHLNLLFPCSTTATLTSLQLFKPSRHISASKLWSFTLYLELSSPSCPHNSPLHFI